MTSYKKCSNFCDFSTQHGLYSTTSTLSVEICLDNPISYLPLYSNVHFVNTTTCVALATGGIIDKEALKKAGYRPMLTPVQGAFCKSMAVVNVIYSSRGEGKTFACVWAMIMHAERNKKQIRCCIIRDTHENIKLSTRWSIMEALPDNLYEFKNDFKELRIFTNPPILCDLFGIADLTSLQKLQGPEYALVWLEEPAPMSDKANAGLSEDVFNAALIVCARQKGTTPRLQVSMNPADQDHWTYRRFFEEPDINPDNPLITKAVFAIPYGDNKDLEEVSRQAVKDAYKDDPASYARYVQNKFVPLIKGKQVTPYYGTGKYTSEVPLIPAQGLEGFRAWDGWMNPVAILGQILPNGRLVFIDTLRGTNCDVRILINDKVLPMLNSPRWKGACKSWRDVGDRTMMTPDQSNINESAARVIERAFNTHFEGGPAHWTHMKRGMDHAFATNIVGKTAFVVNMENRWLDKALSGGWHFKVDNSGKVMSDTPEKRAEESHVGDAFANALNVLMPTVGLRTNKEIIKKMHNLTRARAKSYAVG